MTLNKFYIGFYIDGREAKALNEEIEPADLAVRVVNGDGTPYEVSAKAAAEVGAKFDERAKRKWLRDEEDEIKLAGGDNEEAFRHYHQGRVDQLSANLELDVLDALPEALEGAEEKD